METKLEVIAMLEKLPPFPPHAQQISNFLNDERSDWRKVGKIILKDPVLAGRVLQIANSSFYGLSRKIKDLDIACAVLGIETLRNLVHTLVVLANFRRGQENSLIDYDLFWRNNLRVACMAKAIACKYNQDPSVFFIAGLFHTLDVVVQDYFCREKLLQKIDKFVKGRSNLADIKIYKMINTDSWWIIATLLEYWHFPENVAAVFQKETAESVAQLKLVLLLSNALVEKLEDGGDIPEIITNTLVEFNQRNPALAVTLEKCIQESQVVYQELLSLMLNEN